MKITVVLSLVLVLPPLATHAATVIAEDGGTAAYGDANGFRIDFNATTPLSPNVNWSEALVAGQDYHLNSVAIRYGGSQLVTAPKYLGVYTGFTAGTLSGFLGISDNAIDFTTATAEDWQQYTFQDIQVTADTEVGSGSGMLYFIYQTGTAPITGLETTVSTRRFDGFPAEPVTADYHANILAFGAVQEMRAPEYQATLTAVPEPGVAMLAGLSTAMLMFRRRRIPSGGMHGN